VKGLKWSYIDRKAIFIRLPAEFTKEKAPKDIPINKNVESVLTVFQEPSTTAPGKLNE